MIVSSSSGKKYVYEDAFCSKFWFPAYFVGLFPLLGSAAIKVRPILLQVYESHFLPLGHALRPALPGLLTGVLPGIEDGADTYDR